MTKKKVRKLKTAQQAPSQGQAVKAAEPDVKAKSASAAPEQKTAPISRIQAIKQYLQEVRAEFDKITWPSRKETISMTIAVMVISIFFAAYLGLVDMSLSKLVGVIIK
ncbi:MAG: preprotein translocase subunit SecE [Thermodesulfobacteria bacterium]|nr:preprotein translocase subunit SecE [Thermodesulfobacteriota bacterium]